MSFLFGGQSSKARQEQNRKDNLVTQFCQVTGAGQADAVKYLKKHNYRLEAALDGLYNDPAALAALTGNTNKDAQSSAKKLGDIFDKYKDDEDGDSITVEGTMNFCGDVGLDLEDAVILAVSHELQSKSMGEFTRTGWVDGWKNLKCDSLESMRKVLPSLRSRLSSEPAYFKIIYTYAFDFAKALGQRSIPVENAKAFWAMLLPIGLEGDALRREDGWKSDHNGWWFEFLDAKGGKGISKDVWNMFYEFIRSIDSRFENYDEDAAWPSIIDDFVVYSRDRLKSSQ
ncbi:defective in Cullin neddylation protein 1 [Cantharellus anzutake]|uniref:defective in Cullin neddylation protein 1 n=1 Tax=Cantharellus anzutake TaxID=1750568 RepID=UPI00190379AD|nr:defective in Cullin neddylation protein 1 [Cantharellus anzutake]KAF8330192.1 defective in Cullin neddylation protein 1 [Cantharellus anzutake]